jgi:hypothetical protein
MVFGLSLVLALVFGVATTALAAIPGDPFRLGQTNGIDAMSTLVGNVAAPMLKVDNGSTAAGATALDLRVETGKPPMKVNSTTRVANLNSDKLDGKNASDLQGPRAYAHINADGTLDASRSKNVDRSLRISTGLYCINSTVPPSNVVATLSGSDSGMISQAYGGEQCFEFSTGSYNIQVRTFSSDGLDANRGFDIAIN